MHITGHLHTSGTTQTSLCTTPQYLSVFYLQHYKGLSTMTHCCSRIRWLKAFAAIAGLGATTLLVVAIVVNTWIHIEEIIPVNDGDFIEISRSINTPSPSTIKNHLLNHSQEGQQSTITPEGTLEEEYDEYEYKAIDTVEKDYVEEADSSGEEPKALALHGKMTTWPGQVHTTYDLHIGMKRSFDVGLWVICQSQSYITWVETDFVGSYSVHSDVPEQHKCLGRSPFQKLIDHEEDQIITSSLVGLLSEEHFHVPLFISLCGAVIALLITSGSMVRNSIVILLGAAIYVMSGLVLAISLLWFYQNLEYAPNPTSDKFHYFGAEHVLVGKQGLKFQVRHYCGAALYCAIAPFVLLNMAAAAAVALYNLTATKTLHDKITRRYSEKKRKGNVGEWFVTRL